jgi:prepilin-type N-terminal cleavage/methylation domain-containing protein
MSANSKRLSRGFTLAELLSVLVIMGIFTSFVVMIIAPVIRAPNNEQAKVDTLQAAAQGLYQMQRDIRMADITGVFACASTGGVASCSQPSSLTSTSIITLVSPLSSGQLNWTQSTPNPGVPAWQGVVVYWLQPNGDSNDLQRAYVSSSTLGSLSAGPLGSTFAATAATAVQDAQAAGGVTVANDVNSLSASINKTTNIVGLEITAQSKEGAAANSTSYTSNIYTRN